VEKDTARGMRREAGHVERKAGVERDAARGIQPGAGMEKEAARGTVLHCN
jgi:hypothetical protein